MTAKSNRRGRLAASKRPKKEERLTVAFTTDQYNRAYDAAEDLGVTFAELVRRSLDYYIDQFGEGKGGR